MSKKKQLLAESKVSYTIETEEYPGELIQILKEKNIPFKATKYHELLQDQQEIDEELPFIEVAPGIYQKLKKISEITGISEKDITTNELKHMLTDTLPETPLIFLDTHLGIENVKNPFDMIEKMNEVINIGDKYLNWLKTQDPIKYVKEWYNPLKKSNK